jgi:hypothetical protein
MKTAENAVTKMRNMPKSKKEIRRKLSEENVEEKANL